jgi:exopolyphosphatase/guanosine-5'-triphosphate,3'-diphosphate pyrophosphatase
VNRGVISIGTNSTRALVAGFNGRARVLLARSIGTRIGEGLKERGALDEGAMERTLQVVREHASAVRELTSDVRVIATSALRRAENGEAFANAVRDAAGAPLEIISGEEEARRSFIGAISGIEERGCTYGVLDTGGGSSEYAIGSHQLERIVSCEIGAVRLTEAVPQLAGHSGRPPDAELERARAIALEQTRPIADFPHVNRLMFVGGTATTTVCLQRESRELFDYAEITLHELRRWRERLRDLDLEARRQLPGINPQRADIILGGVLILEVVFERAGHERAIVSTNDLLLGTLLQ